MPDQHLPPRSPSLPPIPGWEGEYPETPIDSPEALVHFIAERLVYVRWFNDVIWAGMNDAGRAAHKKADAGQDIAAEALRNAHRVLPMLGLIPLPDIRPDTPDPEAGLQALMSWLAHLEAPTPSPPEPQQPDTALSDDGRSLRWFGTLYEFSATQAPCVQVLYEAWQNRTPAVSQAHILEAAGVNSDRLHNIFHKSLAWKTLIVPGECRGTYRLAEPKKI